MNSAAEKKENVRTVLPAVVRSNTVFSFVREMQQRKAVFCTAHENPVTTFVIRHKMILKSSLILSEEDS